jgi:lipopolysaccharide/colanic/teichoic acid biosynthesis glycosyltransferase
MLAIFVVGPSFKRFERLERLERMEPAGSLMKRILDIVVSLIGLICLFPLMLLVAVLIKLDSSGPVFFRQERIGRGFRPFQILKFRTMIDNAQTKGRLITFARDPRITRVGRILRQTKIDELPQLINVLKGEMSLVGPRPEVSRYVQAFQKEYEEILNVRPGMTDLASLKYRNEEAMLGQSDDPEEEYIKHVLPDKIRLAKDYVQRSSFIFDLRLICRTMFKLFHYKMSS